MCNREKNIKEYFVIPNFRKRLKTILENYPHEYQMIKTIEEMSELTKELSKYLIQKRNIAFKPNILNEIADIYIMLGQLKMIFNIDEVTIGKKIDEKLTRQIERIESEK